MKTCSDSLKALFHQYRTGERRTWYIADLYTIWIGNSEKIDGLLRWHPYAEGTLSYADAKFGAGLLWLNNDSPNRHLPLIKVSCPSRDYFDWNENDWTIEYFVKYAGWLGYMGSGSIGFAVTDAIAPANMQTGFTIGAVTSSYFQDMCFWTKKPDEAKAHHRIRITASAGGASGIHDFIHIAVSKQGKKIYTFCNGIAGETYTMDSDEILFMSTLPYMCIMSDRYDSEIIDEVRVSSCARYTQPFTVTNKPYVSDVNTLSLLHLNRNLDDEGNMGNPSNELKDFRSGEIFLYTGHDTDLTCGGNKYRHIAIEHGDIEESRGTETATMDLTINFVPTDTINPNDERTWFKAFKDGLFDKAYLSLDRLYSPIPWRYNMPNISIDYVLKSRFYGRMDVQEVKLNSASIQVKSPTDMLSRELPRNLVKPSCLNHFGDFMCQLNPEHYRKSVVAQSGSTNNCIILSDMYADAYYSNGLICSTSGKNKGQYSSIKTFSSRKVVLYKPFREEVNEGDTFDILAGCDKTMKTCEGVYGNMIHFRGCPFLPCKNVLL